MKGLTLSQKEQARLETLNRVLEGQLRLEEAAVVLGVSERHAWRMLAAYRREGAAALAHGNRGRRPANAIPADVSRQVVELARARYAGVNHTHFTELLEEREGIALSRSTVRSILLNAGIKSPKRRRPPKHRVRRRRFPQEGMLLQIDGSIHDWLEDRGPRMTLLLAVDDATGTIPAALFCPKEDSRGYFRLLWRIIERKGIPLALYSDRHGVFWPRPQGRQKVEQGPAGRANPTQFGRAIDELGVEQVFAWSPQAKGRVERVAGTFQDRLVSELRLAGVDNLEGANRVLEAYLPRYNERFCVDAVEDGTAYRPVSPELNLGDVLCFKHRRTVSRDNTVRHQCRALQLLPDADRASYAGKKVEVWEALDGGLSVHHEGEEIPSQEAPRRASLLREMRRKKQARLMERVEACMPTHAEPDEIAETVPRQPTQRMVAYWEAVQVAKSKGLSLRAISRVLGISRATVTKYARLTQPPGYSDGVIEKEDEQQGLTESLVSSP